jgi:hypothetical protein
MKLLDVKHSKIHVICFQKVQFTHFQKIVLPKEDYHCLLSFKHATLEDTIHGPSYPQTLKPEFIASLRKIKYMSTLDCCWLQEGIYI